MYCPYLEVPISNFYKKEMYGDFFVEYLEQNQNFVSVQISNLIICESNITLSPFRTSKLKNCEILADINGESFSETCSSN